MVFILYVGRPLVVTSTETLGKPWLGGGFPSLEGVTVSLEPRSRHIINPYKTAVSVRYQTHRRRNSFAIFCHLLYLRALCGVVSYL